MDIEEKQFEVDEQVKVQQVDVKKVNKETIEEHTVESMLGQSWHPLIQATTSRSFEKTRLSALSVSHDKRLETITEEKEMEQEQEITSVSLCMCMIIKVNYLR